MKTLQLLIVFLVAALSCAAFCSADEGDGHNSNHANHEAQTSDGGHDDHGQHEAHDIVAHHTHVWLMIFMMIIMLTVGRAGAIAEKINCPPVVGELIGGMLLGTLLSLFGISPTEDILSDALIFGAMQMGVALLLYITALEEDVHKMIKVGARATIVAVVGVFIPFFLGFGASQIFYPLAELAGHAFMGATLVATSVGITSAIYTAYKYTGNTRTLVIGAAVIDDVLGLICLSVVSAMATGAIVTTTFVAGKLLVSIAFLGGSIGVGMLIAGPVGNLLSKIHTGVGMKQATALLFCFGFGYAAIAIAELEPILGCFAGGLVLAPVHFKWFDSPYQVQRIDNWIAVLKPDQEQLREEMIEHKDHKDHAHVESLVARLGQFFIPLYFVGTGMSVDLSVFTDPSLWGTCLVFILIAVAGKLPCGIVAGPGVNKWIVAWSMVARGEVGLVFCNLGKVSGKLTDSMFAVLVVTVVVTTFLPPPILSRLIKKEQAQS